uniref:Uncharacterized protein n=1 Tax=Anguilla anguilla TaxID=7936 RepID=A0A0E9WSD2_ANGAN
MSSRSHIRVVQIWAKAEELASVHIKQVFPIIYNCYANQPRSRILRRKKSFFFPVLFSYFLQDSTAVLKSSRTDIRPEMGNAAFNPCTSR